MATKATRARELAMGLMKRSTNPRRSLASHEDKSGSSRDFTKTCEHCGGSYERPNEYADHQWMARRFCSLRCSIEGRMLSAGDVFATRHYRDPVSGCWVWMGSRLTNGYGRIFFQRKKILAHRYSYEAHIGPIPNGMQIDHTCCNPSCVNPSHLEVVSSGENTRRGFRRRQS